MNFSIQARDDAAVDVLVAGGGPAGCAAAIAARRRGLSVLLVEATSALGGTATGGQVAHWLGGRSPGGRWVVGGIFRELAEGAVADGCALLPSMPEGKTYQPYAWLPWFIHGVPLDPYRLVPFLERKLAAEGVSFRYETRVVGVESSTLIARVVTHGKEGFAAHPVRCVIDATGDADVAALAGCPVHVGRDGDHLTTPASLTFHLSHVDHAILQETIEKTRSPKFRELIASLRSTGEWPFPYDIFISVKGLADDEAMINTIRLVGVDGLDADSRTRAYVDGRREALQLLDIFRRHFPGFAQARIKSIAPLLGVRETRRIAGAFTLGVASDLAAGTDFPDTIGFSMYGWDLPDPKRPSVQPLVDESGGGFVNKAKKGLATPIPFRVMVPQGCANLLCPGRAVSVERDVLGPLRVMAPCMAMGEACGVAAEQVVAGTANADVDAAALPSIEPRVDP